MRTVLYVVKKAEGPVFKTWNGQYTTCVYGHTQLSRRLMLTDEDNFPGATVDLTGLFVIGALRGMSGDTHKKYRRVFVQALQGTPLAPHEDAVRKWIEDKLARPCPLYARSSRGRCGAACRICAKSPPASCCGCCLDIRREHPISKPSP